MAFALFWTLMSPDPYLRIPIFAIGPPVLRDMLRNSKLGRKGGVRRPKEDTSSGVRAIMKPTMPVPLAFHLVLTAADQDEILPLRQPQLLRLL